MTDIQAYNINNDVHIGLQSGTFRPTIRDIQACNDGHIGLQ